jgi:hypothetical protein
MVASLPLLAQGLRRPLGLGHAALRRLHGAPRLLIANT